MKTLKELVLLDKFLFDETMDMPEAQEAALQIILEDDAIRLMGEPETEKEMRTAPWLRSIRLDVFSMDQNKVVYNTEMQGEMKPDLVKRSRFYQSLIDSSLLEPGSISFNKLNDSYLIMIMPFDLFGQGRYRYTFRSYCKEDKNLMLNDGAVRIFLNTRGINEDEISKELVNFLRYVEKCDGQIAAESGSERIRVIHECVSRIKSSEEMGVKYMQSWEEKVMEREKGESRINDLYSRLVDAGRMDDLKRATSDKVYRDQLLKEYGI